MSVNLGTRDSHISLLGYDDWFLPSKDELNAMYVELHLNSLGGFVSGNYWSSSELENDDQNAKSQNFSTGAQNLSNKNLEFYVRACRSFVGNVGEYAIGDIGLSGGRIFSYSGGEYYEAAPFDQSIGKTWSDVLNTQAGALDVLIGTGRANTLIIITQVGHTTSAAKLCDDLSV